MTDWLTTFTGLPPDALKAIGTVAVGGLLAGGTYVIARMKEARRPPEQALGLPRVALDPIDRDLGFTIVRTGTDLTRALNDHGALLLRVFPPPPLLPPPPPTPPVVPPRRTRVRRTAP